MCRAPLVALVLLVGGCALPPERLPLRPLPEDSQPLPYPEMVGRARLQASAANESFYVNKWTDLEDAAKGLEQTARHLARATEVPPSHKDKLAVEAGDLGKEAEKLREAAKARDVKQTNEILQRINLMVRELHPST